MNESASQVLLGTLIDALLRDEDWRVLVQQPLDPEIERLMLIAEQIHEAAGDTPRAGTREKLRVWDRLIRRGDGQAPLRRLLTIRGFNGTHEPRLAYRRLGTDGPAPGHTNLRGRVWS